MLVGLCDAYLGWFHTNKEQNIYLISQKLYMRPYVKTHCPFIPTCKVCWLIKWQTVVDFFAKCSFMWASFNCVYDHSSYFFLFCRVFHYHAAEIEIRKFYLFISCLASYALHNSSHSTQITSPVISARISYYYYKETEGIFHGPLGVISILYPGVSRLHVQFFAQIPKTNNSLLTIADIRCQTCFWGREMILHIGAFL